MEDKDKRILELELEIESLKYVISKLKENNIEVL